MKTALERLRAREATVEDLRELLPKLLELYDAATLRGNHCVRSKEQHAPGNSNCIGCAINSAIAAVST
jgi:hypothetical protein